MKHLRGKYVGKEPRQRVYFSAREIKPIARLKNY
jgi:hypothetical protein